MMKKLSQSMETLISNELAESNKNYPPFHSDHEAWGVIEEELMEVEEELGNLDGYFSSIKWAIIHEDSKMLEYSITQARNVAKNLACEAVQIAAMYDKFDRRYSNEERIIE